MLKFALTACLLFFSTTALAQAPTKKLIEWGWDEPDTRFLRTHIEEMERYPFDGVVFHVHSNKGGNYLWEMWGQRRFQADEFQHAIADLKATKFKRFTDCFLRVNVTPGNVDWFDDQAWSVVRNNFAVAAQVAKQGGCKGLMFDVEQYEGDPFNFSKQPHAKTKTFAEYRKQVRQRGRDWIQAVNGQFPDVTILLSFGYRIAQPREGNDRSTADYGLLADFLDGLLDGCTAATRIVDAWEFSYSYKTRERFVKAYKTITEESPGWSAVPAKYRRHVQAGFGVWMDYDWNKFGWSVDDVSQNYFTPDAFADSVRNALDISDEYVWIYTEQPRWWTAEKLPAEYVQALRAAKAE